MPADPALPIAAPPRAALTRRAVLALGAAAALPANALPGGMAGMRIPSEFEPQAAVWLGYDAGHQDFSAALIATLRGHAPLKMLVRSEDDIAAARSAWQERSVDDSGVGYQVDPQALFFVRDAAVFAVGAEGGLGVVDFRWSQYGLPTWCRQRHAGHRADTEACTATVEAVRDGLDRSIATMTRAAVFSTPLAMEGGGVECNGQGLLIANQALWLTRNPTMTRAAIERELLRLPGIRRVIWLPAGLAQDPLHRATIVGRHVGWGTGGHTDEFVRFADERTVLLAWPEEPDASRHPVGRINRARMQQNLEVLSRARDLRGRPLKVLKVPLPRIVERPVVLSADANTAYPTEWTAAGFPARDRLREGDTVMHVAASSYLNYVLTDSLVLLPDYLAHGTPPALQRRVMQTFEQVFPRREIAFVDAIGANWVGGGPHCATLTQPRV